MEMTTTIAEEVIETADPALLPIAAIIILKENRGMPIHIQTEDGMTRAMRHTEGETDIATIIDLDNSNNNQHQRYPPDADHDLDRLLPSPYKVQHRDVKLKKRNEMQNFPPCSKTPVN